ncbi:MAG: 1-deoxy-D-xylulose-5-phosphate reductoisomerase [Brevinema sp.]
MTKNIILLGATGSVGSSVLSVLREYPKKFTLTAFSAWNNVDKTIAIIKEFHPKYVAMQFPHEELISLFPDVQFFFGSEGINELTKIKEADTVVSAILGTAGFLPALSALNQNKHLITANKESLVAGGKFLKESAKKHGTEIIPLDSEHLAIFDLLRGKDKSEVKELVLTASGGPFFRKDITDQTSIQEVLQHPTWNMGASITVGSALMINKGLEVIEAMRLFDLPENQISVLVHPQSIVHGALNMKSGHWHMLASPADMRYPALHSLFYPEAPFEAPFGEYNPISKPLEFFDVDYTKFPLLKLAREVAQADGILPTVLCASMEVAIAKFLEGEVKFIKIPQLIQESLDSVTNRELSSPEEVLEIDQETRLTLSTKIKNTTDLI